MIGFLSMGDVLMAVFPSYLKLMDLGHFTWGNMVENLAIRVADKKVSAMMITEVISVSAVASLMECIDHLIKRT